jgi:hypothetical protein
MKLNFQNGSRLPSMSRGLLTLSLVAGGISWSTAWAATREAWAPFTSVEEHSIADGLPVLALDHDGWQQLVPIGPDTARAAQRVNAVLGAEHSSGWRLGALARSQAAVAVSSDALSLAQAIAGDRSPAADTSFGLGASYVGWRGRGFTVGIPWQSVGSNDWQWTADAQWLQLTDFRYTQLEGTALYQSSTQTYGFDVSSDRASRGITGPFLGISGVKGVGYSVSFAAKGQITPKVQVSFKAEDLLSRLRWGQLAREQLSLNTQVQRRRADGFLDYAPAISGRQSIQAVSARMGARYDTQLAWQYAPTSAASARWHRLAGMNEYWLGWSTRWPERSISLQLGLEAVRQAVAARLTWNGFYVNVGSDGKGTVSQYRHIGLGWELRF